MALAIISVNDFKYTHNNYHLVFLNKQKVQDLKMPPGNLEASHFLMTKMRSCLSNYPQGLDTADHRSEILQGSICFCHMLVFLMRGMGLSHPAPVGFLSSMMQWLSFW